MIPDTEYIYAMIAVNASDQSVDSNVVTSSLLPSCGENFETNAISKTFPQEAGGWAFTANVTERDGLVVKDVRLNGRYMARMMSVPYFSVKTNRMTGIAQRGELTQFSDAPLLRTRLLGYKQFSLTNTSGTELVDRVVVA